MRLETGESKMLIREKVVVILPAYNEELTIADTIRSFHDALPDVPIYVVDNNSSDRTGELANGMFAELNCKGRVLVEPRQGKGNALRRAFMDVDADIFLLSDADSTYPADRAMDMVRPIQEGRADMVVGDRLSQGHYQRENKRPLHSFGNQLVQSLVNRLFNSRLVDIMSGYRAFSREFVKNYPILVEGFQVETDMTLHALHARFRILELPVEYKDRPAGSFSKLNTFADGMRVLTTIAQILRYYRPLLFWGGLAVLAFIGGLLAGLPVLKDWLTYKYIYHVPMAILATGLEIVAVVMIAVGLILDSMVHFHKLEYERVLLQGRANSEKETVGIDVPS
ncbi:MAG: glycosyltransferase [Chloroflexota bacterium]|nr:glycosyltransferase [Chloroflexota bacterium]